MDRRLYLKQLARAVHWRLPEADANEILTDYDEMLSQCPDGQIDTFVERHGMPAQVAKMLTQKRDYYCWLIVFCFLAACLLVPGRFLFLTYFSQLSIPILYLVSLLGFGISLVWFRTRPGIKSGKPYPRRLLVLLLVLLIATANTGAFLASLFVQKWSVLLPRQYGPLAHLALLLTGMISIVFGVYGLIQARLADRRWCALYVLGLAILTACVFLLLLLHAVTIEPFPAAFLLHPTILCVAGILGIAVFLC